MKAQSSIFLKANDYTMYLILLLERREVSLSNAAERRLNITGKSCREQLGFRPLNQVFRFLHESWSSTTMSRTERARSVAAPPSAPSLITRHKIEVRSSKKEIFSIFRISTFFKKSANFRRASQRPESSIESGDRLTSLICSDPICLSSLLSGFPLLLVCLCPSESSL